MSYLIKITNNGEIRVDGNGCRVTSDMLKAAISEFNAKAASQNVLGHLCRGGCDEAACIGFSHKVASAFCNGGEGFAVIEPIDTPDGHELNRIMKVRNGIDGNSNGYEFAAKGYMDQNEFKLTSVDVVKK